MAESNPRGGERILADALRQEAAASRPEFSESLHARLCDAVRRSHEERDRRVGRGTSPTRKEFEFQLVELAPRPSLQSTWRRRWAVALAAAIALLAAVVVWQRIEQPGSPGPDIAARVAPHDDPAADLTHVTELAEQATDALDSLMDRAISSQQWAGLDDDARTALSAVIDHLPPDISSALAFSEPAM